METARGSLDRTRADFSNACHGARTLEIVWASRGERRARLLATGNEKIFLDRGATSYSRQRNEPARPAPMCFKPDFDAMRVTRNEMPHGGGPAAVVPLPLLGCNEFASPGDLFGSRTRA